MTAGAALSPQERRARLAQLLKQKAAQTEQFPLSFAQERLWFLQQLVPESSAYLMPRAIRLRGPLEVNALQKALQSLADRHEALRTTFAAQNGQPVQIVAPNLSAPFSLTDLSHLSQPQQEEEIQRIRLADLRHPFDLTASSPYRAQLLRLADDDHILLQTLHHIISDGWSMRILFRELGVFYDAHLAGTAARLPDLPIQYADFAQWQRKQLQADNLETDLAYWRQHLGDPSQRLDLPLDHARPPVQTDHGAIETRQLPPALSQALKTLSQLEGVTLFMTLLAAFKTLLYRYTGQPAIRVGTVVAGRNRPEVENVIGLFANTLALQTDCSDNPPFRRLIQRVRQATLGAFSHQELPFEKLVKALQPERDLSRNPLVQVFFGLNNLPKLETNLSGLTADLLPPPEVLSKFDLTLDAEERGDTLHLEATYNPDLFDAATISRLLGHLENLLTSLAADPDQRVSDLQMLGQDERRQLLTDWNQTAADHQADKPIHHYVEQQVISRPHATALIFGERHLTYGQLNQQAEKIAVCLIKQGLKPGQLVGLYAQRSLDTVAGLLGILKAGGVYLPLDPAYPPERLHFILKDAAATLVLTQEALAHNLPDSLSTLCIDKLSPCLPTSLPPCPPAAPAYIIYTSGSTGQPKGVMVSHRAAVDHFLTMRGLFELTPADCVTQFAGLSFDVSLEQIFTPLFSGASLVLRDEAVWEPGTFFRLAQEHGITVSDLPPAYLHQLAQELLARPEMAAGCPLRLISVGGEALSPQTVRLWQQTPLSHIRLLNIYGPTEAVIAATAFEVRPDFATTSRQTVPIGRPLANRTTYILDRYGNLLPIGVPGELHVGGPILAEGYLNRPDLTAEKFVARPACLSGGETSPQPPLPPAPQRLYKTGDLARYLPNGNIEFLGRIDQQVKVRGLRIELGEIEAVLQGHPQVNQAVVILYSAAGSSREAVLVAYYTSASDEGLQPEHLRTHLSDLLPAYMVPLHYIHLAAIPRTPNDKVDRRALPAPRLETAVGTVVPPAAAIEKDLAGLWADLLGLKRVGVESNFFELGGHSLLAMRLLSRLNETFNVALPLRVIFEAPTITQLAERLQVAGAGRHLSTRESIIAPRDGTEAPPLSFAQQRLWFLDKLEPASPAYNIFQAFRLSGPLNFDALTRSLNEIARRHDSLRTAFGDDLGQPVQIIAKSATLLISQRDLHRLPPHERGPVLQQLLIEEARRPFDLSAGPLIRAMLIQTAADTHILCLTMHHIISDGWSWDVFNRELSALYAAFAAGDTSPLADLPIQYADFALWQRDWLRGERLDNQLAYWKQQLGQLPSALELPTDYPRPLARSYRGARQKRTLSPHLTQALKALGRQHDATLFMTLLAALKILLFRYTNQTEITVGTPIANRSQPATEALIGFFVNTLVLRSDMSGRQTVRQLLAQVRRTALDAYEHLDLPFEMLVEALQPERTLNQTPLFQVMFVFQNAPADPLRLPQLTVEPLETDRQIAKFDLTLNAVETPDGLRVTLIYSQDLFEAATIKRMLGHLETLLAGMVASPDQMLLDLPLLTQAEETQLLAEWNSAPPGPAPTLSLPQLFEAQVKRIPDRPAIIFENDTLTYRDLNARANQLAHYLIKQGVRPETLVGLYTARSLEMVVGLLAILKAGGAYVPLDPKFPPQRRAFILGDAGVNILLTQAHLAGQQPPDQVRQICLDTDWPRIAAEAMANPEQAVPLNAPAYVIYTSGSTGQPKGVIIEQQQSLHYIQAIIERVRIEPGASFAMLQPLAVDSSQTVIFPAFHSGGTLHIISEDRAANATALADYFEAHQIDLLKIAPSHLAALQTITRPERVLPRRWLIVGGEASRRDWLKSVQALAPHLSIFNHYGPTETTVGVTTYHFGNPANRHPSQVLPIGRPLPNVRAYILDPQGQPVPIGVPGELHIGGPFVARGYLNRPELTTKKFIEVPFGRGRAENTPPPPHPPVPQRLYKTGDMTRWLPDGNIEFLGRLDDQVKIRGFRIELGEIEAALGRLAAVREVVVVAHGTNDSSPRLIAYCVTDPSLSETEVRQALKSNLPDYMIPAQIICLDALPRTAHGKLDRQALPEPGRTLAQSERDLVPPGTAAEQTLHAIWQTVLKQDIIGIHDNFFDLGGDSILSIQIIARANQAGLRLTPRQLFEHQTIAGLAAVANTETFIQAQQTPVTGLIPLTPVQHRFLNQPLRQRHHWNMSRLLTVPPDLDLSLLADALLYLVNHHDALRMRFVETDSGWQQISPGPRETINLIDIDLGYHPPQNAQTLLKAEIAIAQAGLNLSSGPLLQATYFRLGQAEQDRLLLVVHHLVVDAVSWQVLLSDLNYVYEQLRTGRDSQLPLKTTAFKAWAERLTQYAQSDDIQRQLAYWQPLLQQRASSLPTDFKSPPEANTEASARAVTFRLATDETETLLRRLPQQYKIDAQTALLAALVQAITAWTGEDNVCLALESHGRSAQGADELFKGMDLTRTVGWFTAHYPLCLSLNGAKTPQQVLETIQAQLAQVPDQGLGYGLLRYLNPAADSPGDSPHPTVTFNYLGHTDTPPDESHYFQTTTPPNANRAADNQRGDLLYVAIWVTEGQLQITVEYSRNLHRQETIERLAVDFKEYLRGIANACQTSEHALAARNFPLADLIQAKLDEILARYPNVADIYPLSPMQQEILAHVLANPGSTAYRVQTSGILRGELDTEAFRRAWQVVVNRHPALRAAFWRSGGTTRQIILNTVDLPIFEDDWRTISPPEQQERLAAHLTNDLVTGFNLAHPPLLRLSLIRLSEERHQFTWSQHHIVSDGWSKSHILREVSACYQAFRHQVELNLPAVPDYNNYVRWLREQKTDEAETFWREMLKGWDPTLDPDHQPVPQPDYAEIQTVLSSEITAALQTLARQHRLTLNTLIQGAWALTLGHLSAQPAVTFGMVVSGRAADMAAADSMVGLFINTLPLRVTLAADENRLPWLHHLQTQQIVVQQFAACSSADIRRWANLAGDAPLFESTLRFQNYPARTSLRNWGPGLRLEQIQGLDRWPYPLNVEAVPGDKLLLRIGYQRPHFEETEAQTILEQLADRLKAFTIELGTID